MVGASLQLARSVHPERMYVGALMSKMAGRCASCRGTGGGCFHIKQNYCIHQHSFPGFDIQHSTFYHPPGADGPPLSPERETYCTLFIG